MKVFLNNQVEEINVNMTLYDLLISKNMLDKKGIAIALNESVIAKSDWNNVKLKEADRIMIITATAGG